MSARKSLIVVSLVVLLALAGLLARNGQRPDPVPPLQFTLLDGSRVELAALRGRPVLVTFWSLSCPPCLEEVPELRRAQETLGPRGLEIIAVAMAYDPPTAVLDYATRQALPYRVAFDLDGNIARAFGGIAQLPRSVVIGPDGTVAGGWLGKVSVDRLKAALHPYLH